MDLGVGKSKIGSPMLVWIGEDPGNVHDYVSAPVFAQTKEICAESRSWREWQLSEKERKKQTGNSLLAKQVKRGRLASLWRAALTIFELRQKRGRSDVPCPGRWLRTRKEGIGGEVEGSLGFFLPASKGRS